MARLSLCLSLPGRRATIHLASLDAEQVRAIAFEIAMLGRSGLDYASPEKKYTLRSIPDETFSGLQLMCLMHAGFKRVAPKHDVDMDLDEPFLTALQIHRGSDHNR